MKIAMIVTPAALAVLSGTVLASFEVRSADTTGSPITASASFFQSSIAGPGPFPPSPELIESSIPTPDDFAEYDSYVAIDVGPSVGGAPDIKGDGFHANPGDLASIPADPFIVPNQVNAVWFMNPLGPRPEVASIGNPIFGGRHAMFLARLSFRSFDGNFPSETLSLGSNGIGINIRDFGTLNVGSPASDSLIVRFTDFNQPSNIGLDEASLTFHLTGNSYELREVVTLAGPLPGGTARWRIHDLYVVEVPGPGAMSLLGIAGLVAVRRRRSS